MQPVGHATSWRRPAALAAMVLGLATSPLLAEETVVRREADREDVQAPTTEKPKKLVIGATAEVVEMTSGIVFKARIDTGATTCSIHAEDIRVEDEKKSMLKNVGKKVSFVLIGPDDQRVPIESTIADTVRVKTSDKDRWERRYKVWMTLRHNGVSRRVHVTLNNRKHMEYQLLIGRNYLSGRFLVDVAEEYTPERQVAATSGRKTDDKQGAEEAGKKAAEKS